MYWANLLHIYQPPTQFRQVTREIARQSYEKIIKILKENPTARLTLNIPGCLTEQLVKEGFSALIATLAQLVKRGQVELTATAKYHPLLPKIPKEEVVRQIKLNHQTNQKYFEFCPRGFFLPEMAYSEKLGRILEKLGFDWIILDGSAFPKDQGQKRPDAIYQFRESQMAVFFRDNGVSLAIAFGKATTVSDLKTSFPAYFGKKGYFITAMDGETFGHHHKELLTLLKDLYRCQEIPSVTLSSLFAHFRKRIRVVPLRSTWGVTQVVNGRIFPRWDNPDNPIHLLQWQLTDLALTAVGGSQAQKTKKWQKARKLLDQALHSDQYFWAAHDPCWHPFMVERGAKLLRDVVLTAPVGKSVHQKARELYEKIVSCGRKLYGEKVVLC